MFWKNYILVTIACTVLASCDPPAQLSESPEPIADFRLGFVKVSATNTESFEISREVDETIIEEKIIEAIRERLGRYKGNRWYHITVSVEGVFLAPPGFPIVASPRSVMIIKLQVWDDEAGQPLNSEPIAFPISEPFSFSTLIGSGYTRDKDEQARILARQAASVIELWLKSPEDSPFIQISQKSASHPTQVNETMN